MWTERRVVAALVLAVVTSVVAGTAPPWFLANVPPKTVLAGGSRASATLRRRFDISTMFVVTQVAVAFMLMVGAGLVSRSFASLLAVNPGFEAPRYTPESSRRARGVEIWAALASLGRSGLAELVERGCRFAQRFAEGFREAGFEVLNEVELN